MQQSRADAPSARLPPASAEVPMRRIGLAVVLAVGLTFAPLASGRAATAEGCGASASSRSPGPCPFCAPGREEFGWKARVCGSPALLVPDAGSRRATLVVAFHWIPGLTRAGVQPNGIWLRTVPQRKEEGPDANTATSRTATLDTRLAPTGRRLTEAEPAIASVFWRTDTRVWRTQESTGPPARAQVAGSGIPLAAS